MNQTEIMLNATLKIRQIEVKITTLPSASRPEWRPILHLHIEDVLVQSTNGKWQVVELGMAKEIDPKDDSIMSLFKVIQVRNSSYYWKYYLIHFGIV